MAEFIPLSQRLKLHWSTPFDELPDDLKTEVSEAFPYSSWDGRSSEWRQQHAATHDFNEDPANKAWLEHDFSLVSKIGDLERERRSLELMRATSPLELESQNRQFEKIDAQIATIHAQRNAPAITTETSKQRNARLLKRRKELVAAHLNNPTQMLAKEFGISDGLVRRIIRESKPKPKKPGGIMR